MRIRSFLTTFLLAVLASGSFHCSEKITNDPPPGAVTCTIESGMDQAADVVQCQCGCGFSCADPVMVDGIWNGFCYQHNSNDGRICLEGSVAFVDDSADCGAAVVATPDCGNGSCEQSSSDSALTETATTCPADCAPVSEVIAGNDKCESGGQCVTANKTEDQTYLWHTTNEDYWSGNSTYTATNDGANPSLKIPADSLDANGFAASASGTPTPFSVIANTAVDNFCKTDCLAYFNSQKDSQPTNWVCPDTKVSFTRNDGIEPNTVFAHEQYRKCDDPKYDSPPEETLVFWTYDKTCTATTEKNNRTGSEAAFAENMSCVDPNPPTDTGATTAPLLAAPATKPYIGTNSAQVELDPATSFVRVIKSDLGVDEKLAPNGGSLYLEVDKCSAASCPIRITWMKATFDTTTVNYTGGSKVLTDPWAANTRVFEGTIDAAGNIALTESSVELMMHEASPFIARFRAASTSTITGELDRANRTFSLSGGGAGTLALSNGESYPVTYELSLSGPAVRLPPRADAGPDQLGTHAILCDPRTGVGAVPLDGTQSSDPEGQLVSWVWYAVDNQTSRGASGRTAWIPLSIGTHEVELLVLDAQGLWDTDAMSAEVKAGRPPIVTTASDTIELSVCTSEPQLVALPLPDIVDYCSASVVLEGSIVEVNGRPLSEPALVDSTTGEVALMPGSTFVVEWVATGDGGSTVVTQTGTIGGGSSVACCGANQLLIEGTAGRDGYRFTTDPAVCVLAYDGDDRVTASLEADFLSGGNQDDTLNGYGGDDVLMGDAGDDRLVAGVGYFQAFGGPGLDVIDARDATNARLFGNAGNDVIVGSPGSDLVVPGPGVDRVDGRSGDDTIVIYDTCEIQPLSIIDGGDGFDTLVSPVSAASLLSMGVGVANIEKVEVVTSQAHLAECYR